MPQSIPIPKGATLQPLKTVPIPEGATIEGQSAAPVSTGTSEQFLHSAGLPTFADFGKAGSDLATGAAQGAASTVGNSITGIGGLINKIPLIGDLLSPRVGLNALQKHVDARSAPENTTQSVGKGVEQVGEMLLPSGLEEKTVSLLPQMGKYSKLIVPAVKLGVNALEGGVRNASQGGDFTGGAEGGAIGSGVSQALPMLAPLLKNSAQREYSQVLAPTTKANKNITQRVVPQLLDRNEVHSASGLFSKAEGNVDRLGSEIDKAVTAVPSSVKPDTQNIVDHLEKFKNDFRVNNVDVDPDAVNKASELQGIVKQLGPDVSYQSLNKVRQIWDAKVAKAGGYAGKTLAEGSMIDAQREGATAIRRELAKQSPDIAKINAEFSLWKGVSDVLGDTAERRAGQSGGLVRKTIPYLAGAAGVAHGGPTVQGGIEAIGAAMVMGGVNHLIESGAFKTFSAVQKNKLANAIMNGNAQEFTKALSRSALTATSRHTGSQLSTNTTTNSTQAASQP